VSGRSRRSSKFDVSVTGDLGLAEWSPSCAAARGPAVSYPRCDRPQGLRLPRHAPRRAAGRRAARVRGRCGDVEIDYRTAEPATRRGAAGFALYREQAIDTAEASWEGTVRLAAGSGPPGIVYLPEGMRPTCRAARAGRPDRARAAAARWLCMATRSPRAGARRTGRRVAARVARRGSTCQPRLRGARAARSRRRGTAALPPISSRSRTARTAGRARRTAPRFTAGCELPAVVRRGTRCRSSR
jgi:hypothetical protein